jgi:hypothetical protein
MYSITRRRYPKGTWMRLVSAERLRSFIGPEPSKKMSGRNLAIRIGKSPGFITHLTSGRRSSCLPETARRIAEALEVPMDVLFVTHVPSATATPVKRKKVAA